MVSRDNSTRTIPWMPGHSEATPYGSVTDCASLAIQYGFPGFAVQDGGACFGSANMFSSYAALGMSSACSNGKTSNMPYRFIFLSALFCLAQLLAQLQ